MKLTDREFSIKLKRSMPRSDLKKLKKNYYSKERAVTPSKWYNEIIKISQKVLKGF